MKGTILLFTLIISCIYIKAQKQTFNWAFGYNCGLTWNTTQNLEATGIDGTSNAIIDGLPTFFQTSMQTLEGCFSLSDNDGNLLFYSDGMTIYNKNNEVMQNGSGLTGHSSSCQSGILLPYPGKTNQYMAVTLGELAANNLSYSIIDMTLNEGLGGVDEDNKNVEFPRNTSYKTGESVTSIRHKNNNDYWVSAVAKGRSNTYLFSWLVTTEGVGNPISSLCPTHISQTSSNGYLKFTPDGNHFVFATYEGGCMMYGDFDRSTGKFSNIKTISGLTQPYGVEFSSSMKYLYLVCSKGVLRVYNLEELLTTQSPMLIKPKIIQLGISSGVSAAQIGPDKRIYITPFNQSYLYIVDNPDEYDNLNVYRLPNDFLKNSKAKSGLPSFAASWFLAKGEAKSFNCAGNDSKYTIEVSLPNLEVDRPTRLVWDFGDGSKLVPQYITGDNKIYYQMHEYTKPGTYEIKVTPYKKDDTSLSPITIKTNIVDCLFRSNRMIRTDLQNTNTIKE